MRVVHLSAYGGPYPGSFVPMLRAVNDAAAKRDWPFLAVFTPEAALHPWYSELVADGVAVRVAPDGSRRQLASWTRRLVTERHESTVLHSHFTTFDLPAVAAARHREGTLAMWHMHNPPGLGLHQVARNALKFALAGRSVDRILCVSEETAEMVRRRCAPAERVIVFPNAIDLTRFLPPATEAERQKARAELGIEQGRVLLVHFGWDWERKGGDLFLTAVDVLARSGRDVLGLCVGVIEASLGVLWSLQGAGAVHLRPILCVANCKPVTEGSASWLTLGVIFMLLGIAIVGASVRWRIHKKQG